MKGRRISYSSAELQFIQAHSGMARRELHEAFVRAFARLDVTADNIKALCTRNGWSNGTNTPWLAADDAMLRALYPDTKAEDAARQLGRSLTSVYARAKELGLRKSASFLASESAGRVRKGEPRGAATRFAKGHAPANKGTRRPGFAPGRMRETQFRGGQSSWNEHPIGAERIIGGYHWTKISDTPRVVWTKNWRQTHVLRWEADRGPLPKGMILKCVGGDTQNPDPSNWEAVPRGVLPRLNGKSGRGYDRAPRSLKQTIMAVAKLEHAAAQARKVAR